MNYLYLLLDLGSLAIPFIFSFHPKLKFYKYWKALTISTAITMVVFVPWDVIFTKWNIWGFNNLYFLGYKCLGLPLEEWLFFICIPYACVFTHYALLSYFPNKKISKKTTVLISYLLLSASVITSLFFYYKWYTFINFGFMALLLLVVLQFNVELLRQYYLTFLVMLVPFFIVNGLLTGSIINGEVVWYNNTENLSVRLLTIPIEDVGYAFSLILLNLFIIEEVNTP